VGFHGACRLWLDVVGMSRSGDLPFFIKHHEPEVGLPIIMLSHP
jgi:hypothetical protein